MTDHHTSTFKKSSDFYDLVYSSKDYSEEASFVLRLLKKYNFADNKILEYGSGTGKHAQVLCNLGYDITGVVLSE